MVFRVEVAILKYRDRLLGVLLSTNLFIVSSPFVHYIPFVVPESVEGASPGAVTFALREKRTGRPREQ